MVRNYAVVLIKEWHPQCFPREKNEKSAFLYQIREFSITKSAPNMYAKMHPTALFMVICDVTPCMQRNCIFYDL